MRLLIAGILSLVIYLMACGYKNEETTENKVEIMNDYEQHSSMKINQFDHFIFQHYSLDYDFQPPYAFKEISTRSKHKRFQMYNIIQSTTSM